MKKKMLRFLVALALLALATGAGVSRGELQAQAGNIDITQVEQQIKAKVDMAYARGKKLGYREGVFASQKHFTTAGESTGKKAGYVCER